jgi:hypothetical protein
MIFGNEFQIEKQEHMKLNIFIDDIEKEIYNLCNKN